MATLRVFSVTVEMAARLIALTTSFLGPGFEGVPHTYVEILTFIEFPEAGYYTAIFNRMMVSRFLKRMELATAVDLLKRLQWRPWCIGHNLWFCSCRACGYPFVPFA